MAAGRTFAQRGVDAWGIGQDNTSLGEHRRPCLKLHKSYFCCNINSNVINKYAGFSHFLSSKMPKSKQQTPRVVIFAGPNGAGKSTHADAILAALGLRHLLMRTILREDYLGAIRIW